MSTIIDWEDIRNGYNDMFATHYEGLRTLLSELYEKVGSSYRMEEILGISRNAIFTKMHSLNILSHPRGGGEYRAAVKTNRILEIDREEMKTLIAGEIAERAGCSVETVWNVLKRNGIEYRRRRAKNNISR